jgi:hypothetical protein
MSMREAIATRAPRRTIRERYVRSAVDSGVYVGVLVENVDEILEEAGDALEDAQEQRPAPLAAVVAVSLVPRVLDNDPEQPDERLEERSQANRPERVGEGPVQGAPDGEGAAVICLVPGVAPGADHARHRDLNEVLQRPQDKTVR